MIELSLVDQEVPNSCIAAHPDTTLQIRRFGAEFQKRGKSRHSL
jgi:hypothetical protein